MAIADQLNAHDEVIGILETLPPLILSPLLAVYIDRSPKKWVMIGVDGPSSIWSLQFKKAGYITVLTVIPPAHPTWPPWGGRSRVVAVRAWRGYALCRRNFIKAMKIALTGVMLERPVDEAVIRNTSTENVSRNALSAATKPLARERTNQEHKPDLASRLCECLNNFPAKSSKIRRTTGRDQGPIAHYLLI
jgi:hypothetical protein